MSRFTAVLGGLFVVAMLALLPSGCSCGFDCNNSDGRGTTVLTLGFSDALPEDLKQVVIEVDSITFRRNGVEEVVVDTFTIPDLGLVDAETFQIDLLDYQGRNQLVVLEGFELDAGSYAEVRIRVLGNDVNRSYVQEEDDTLRELSVSGGVLSVPGKSFSRGSQVFTIEFNLPLALQVEDSGLRYQLANVGVRLENNATTATVSGRVDSSLFDTVEPCDAKEEPTEGNRIYIYEGSSTNRRFADVFRSSSSNNIPNWW